MSVHYVAVRQGLKGVNHCVYILRYSTVQFQRWHHVATPESFNLSLALLLVRYTKSDIPLTK